MKTGEFVGREKLIQAQQTKDADVAKQANEDKIKEEGGKACSLARQLIEFCIEQAPNRGKVVAEDINLKPIPEKIEVFRIGEELGDKYEIENLHLKISPLQAIHRYFELRYDSTHVKSFEADIYDFLALGDSASNKNWKPNETYLRGHEGGNNDGLNRKIEIDSPEYKFIYNVSGLFIPNFLDDLARA